MKGKRKGKRTGRTLTGGGVVVNRGWVLLVLQRGQVWSLPKGHIESGESAEDAARRETEEESGIPAGKLSLVRELGVYERPRIGLDKSDDPSETKEIHMFHFVTKEERLRPGDKKILGAMWVKPKVAVELLTHPKDAAFLRGVIDSLG